MNEKMLKVVRCVNVPHHICDHLLGDHHSPIHRIACGVCVMMIGTVIAVEGGHAVAHLVVIHHVVDLIGYGIHGVGLTPIVEQMVATAAAKEGAHHE